MKHTLTVLVLPLVLSSCERDHGDPLVTPPDAPGDEAPDTSAGPGAGNPLEPDQRIECELQEGYMAYLDANGRETQRWTQSLAVAGDTAPSGNAWSCLDEAPSSVCLSPVGPCKYEGDYLLWQCSQTLWSRSVDGLYYVACGTRVEVDPDGDGIFTVQQDPPAMHVAITN